ncbi:MAG: hypothetical protein ACI4OI_00695 [Gemmiger sp.]
MRRRINKRCEVRGELMIGVDGRKKFCPECLAARIRESNNVSARARYVRRKPPRRSPAQRREGMSIEQINQLADAAGLTYGQYVAKNQLH